VSDGGRAHLRGGLHAGLISAPQNDLRHTLHVGYDGVVFGDLSQIGHDTLPVDATGVMILLLLGRLFDRVDLIKPVSIRYDTVN